MLERLGVPGPERAGHRQADPRPLQPPARPGLTSGAVDSSRHARQASRPDGRPISALRGRGGLGGLHLVRRPAPAGPIARWTMPSQHDDPQRREHVERLVDLRANREIVRLKRHAAQMKRRYGGDLTNEDADKIIAIDAEIDALDAESDEIKAAIEGANERSGSSMPMTNGQKAVWDALRGSCKSAKELASDANTSAVTVRQHVLDLRRAGRKIPLRSGRGYWRPDAPPPA